MVLGVSYCYSDVSLSSSSEYSFPELELNAKYVDPEEGYEKNLKYNTPTATVSPF